ncbi:hypothetical protein ACFL0J_08535 [Candidatus Neomarinimicrobiota bacterium]
MLKKVIIVILIFVVPMFSSGGYDHGTSTGKGQLELDFTWNPFDLIEFGQTYIVVGYGLTNHFDIHGYYAHQTDGQDNYYYGLFYQFIDSKYIDLATAVGGRHYTKSEETDLFFPQLLFNFKLDQDFAIGGAIVNINKITGNSLKTKGLAFDIAMYIPLSKEISLPKFIREIKLAFGVFNPGVFDSDHGKFLPTYSIDITFKRIRFSD